MSLFVAYRKEWKELIRTYRLLVVAIVLAFFGLTSPLAAKLIPEVFALIPVNGMDISQLIPTPTVWDAIAQYIKNMPQFGIILSLLVTMGTIAQEKDKGTAAMMLVKPLPRSAFIGAKFLVIATMFAISLAVAGIGCYYYTLLLFEAMDVVAWLVLNGLMLVYVLVPIAITLFCSTLFRSQIAAGGTALGIVLAIALLGSIPWLSKYLPGELVTWGARLMHGDTTTSWVAFGVSIGLVVVSLLGAWLTFRGQEL
jgi:ABC-2 type transport system permease protein